MATKKKVSSKKGYSKKTSTKKTSAKKSRAAKPTSDQVTLNLALDAGKAEAIKRCIDKGQLSITVSRVNLDAGRVRLGDPYKYD